MTRRDVRAAVAGWESLLRAQVALMRRFIADDIWTTVTIREYDVLFTLSKFGGMRLNRLNEEILLSQPSLSRLVDRLVARGYLTKTAATDDGRGTWIELTDSGADVQHEIGRAHAQRIARYVGDALSAQELQQLAQLTEKLRLAQGGIARETTPSRNTATLEETLR